MVDSRLRPARADVLDARPAEALDAATRVRELVRMMGPRDEAARPLADALRGICRELWDRHVRPLLVQHWPEALDGRHEAKLRFLTVSLYAPAPLTVLLCSERPPRRIRVGTGIARRLRLDQRRLYRGAALLSRAFAATARDGRLRRIVIVAAFIAAIDHTFDHLLPELAPAERARRVHGLLDGTVTADRAPLRLVRALLDAMGADLDDADRPHFDLASRRVHDWLDAEVNGMTGVPDPRDLGWRLPGVEGTIDGLVFPVHRHVSAAARRWMVDVSLYTQMMDDWIDYEADRRDLRSTPVITGRWTLPVLREQWLRTLSGIEALARDAGWRREPEQAFLRDAYVYLMADVRRAMVEGVAA